MINSYSKIKSDNTADSVGVVPRFNRPELKIMEPSFCSDSLVKYRPSHFKKQKIAMKQQQQKKVVPPIEGGASTQATSSRLISMRHS